jgi:purine-cytosine permease-like protein
VEVRSIDYVPLSERHGKLWHLGGFWLMALGALLAASAGKSFDTVKSIYDTGNGIFDGFGTIVLLFSALGLISVTALNLYGGSLTLISAVDSFRRVRPTLFVRVAMIGFTAALSLVVAFAASANFLDNFNSFLLLILYLFVPWTAVNLIDYYVVRSGHYAVAEIFKADGIYGRWAWRGIAAYVIGLAAMVPFFSTPKFTGWVAKAMDGAEARLAEREMEELERVASAHAAI